MFCTQTICDLNGVKGLFLFMLLLALVSCGNDKTAVQVDCNLDAGPCTKKIAANGAVTVTLDISPRPLSTMKRLLFRVKAEEKDSSLKDAEVFITLTMPGMSMMENRIQLRQQEDHSYQGDGVIVKCSSGKKIWKADVLISRPGNSSFSSINTSFLFRVDR
ncbi:MAG: hypothetical protein C0402_08180 [Thermodesulfovibrio sp.]|nr:hypothetical protein [Thermodesulfovibrio sp.]